MHRRRLLKAFAGLALCPLCARTGLSAEGAHWGYEGSLGPSAWGDLDPANRVCAAGSQQSPIVIGDTIEAELPPLEFAWARQADTIVNNGHTIQINFEDGGSLKTGSGRYTLVQFHFHHPSEHIFGDRAFAMEAHFVHKGPSGALAVAGVMMTIGKPNPVFSEIVASMPSAGGAQVKANPKINPAGLLPAKRDYFLYEGSLTTPPCSETVAWHLLRDPIEVDAESVAAFAKLYPMNARPVQKLDRRFVLRSS
jgi:carbonic anhydrase